MTNIREGRIGRDQPPDTTEPINGKVWAAPPLPTSPTDTALVRRGLLNAAGLLLAAALTVAIVLRPEPAPTQGSPVPASSAVGSIPGERTLPRDPLPDIGWATQPIDGPNAVPPSTWIGWAGQPHGRCAWMPAELPKQLGSVAAPVDDGAACRLDLANHDHVKITWGFADEPMLWDPLRKEHVAEVGGLQARVFDLVMNRALYPGACQVSVHTRGLTDLAVLAWHQPPHGQATTRPRCQLAEHTSERIVRARVDATGGTPWQPTPQTPSYAVVDKVDLCELLVLTVDNYIPIPAHDDRGHPRITHRTRECTVAAPYTRLSSAITQQPRPGLALVAPETGARITPIELGPLDARTESTSAGCAAVAEIAPGRTLRFQYTNLDAKTRACGITTMFLTRAVRELLSRTPSPNAAHRPQR
jgi:hypothetical protein